MNYSNMGPIGKDNWHAYETLICSYFSDQIPNKLLLPIICPPYTEINSFLTHLSEHKVRNLELGTQNISHKSEGALTGEISSEMLHVRYAIVGHSERRAYLNETNELINKKINLMINKGMIPIFCVGETLEQRQNNLIKNTLRDQLTKGLNGIENKNIIIAYEPVWAIGTGETASSEMISEAHQMIRNILNDIGFDGEKISILYGGSVNRNNAEELIELEDVDGFLIGGASLDAEHFYDIYKYIEESI